MPMASSCIVAGDLNVHHKRWLRYSNGDTSQGQLLQRIALWDVKCELAFQCTLIETLVGQVVFMTYIAHTLHIHNAHTVHSWRTPGRTTSMGGRYAGLQNIHDIFNGI